MGREREVMVRWVCWV